MTLTESLKRAIADSGLSHYRISKETGVDASVLDRFVSGERDITLSTADKLAAFFKIDVKLSKPPTRTRRRK